MVQTHREVLVPAAVLWQEPRGEGMKTTRFQRKKLRKPESSCPLPAQCNHRFIVEELTCSE